MTWTKNISIRYFNKKQSFSSFPAGYFHPEWYLNSVQSNKYIFSISNQTHGSNTLFEPRVTLKDSQADWQSSLLEATEEGDCGDNYL